MLAATASTSAATSRIIYPNWFNIAGDAGWMGALLSWYAATNNPPRADAGLIYIETCLQPVRPHIHERLELAGEGGGKMVLRSLYSGDTFARISGASPLQFRPTSELTPAASSSSLTIRASDHALLKSTPHSFFFHCVCDLLPFDRACTSRAALRVMPHTNYQPGSVLSFRKLEVDACAYFEVSCNGQVCCQIAMEMKGPMETRYDVGRKTVHHPEFSKNSARTRDLPGAPPVTRALSPFPFEITGAGGGYLHQGTLALSEVMDHIFDPTAPFRPKPGAGEDITMADHKDYTAFWRSAAVQVFDTRVDVSSNKGSLNSVCWIDRCGSSSLEIRSDFYDSTHNKLVAAARVTLVVIEIASRRPANVGFDKEWVESRYAYGRKSPVARQALQPLPAAAATSSSWSSPPFSFPLHLRHTDQDINGHVNSIKYLSLADDAKLAAMQAGYLPTAAAGGGAASLNVVPSRSWIDYIGELHLDERHPACVQVQYQVVGNKQLTKYDFLNKQGDTRACASVVVETDVVVGAAAKL